jgi:hypothetical protein
MALLKLRLARILMRFLRLRIKKFSKAGTRQNRF